MWTTLTTSKIGGVESRGTAHYMCLCQLASSRGANKRTIDLPKVNLMNSLMKEIRFWTVNCTKWITYYIKRIDYQLGFSQNNLVCGTFDLFSHKFWPVFFWSLKWIAEYFLPWKCNHDTQCARRRLRHKSFAAHPRQFVAFKTSASIDIIPIDSGWPWRWRANDFERVSLRCVYVWGVDSVVTKYSDCFVGHVRARRLTLLSTSWQGLNAFLCTKTLLFGGSSTTQTINKKPLLRKWFLRRVTNCFFKISPGSVKRFNYSSEKPRQNGRKMTSFRGTMAKLGAGVDNELGGSALHQCR